jgi:hypothetical protein
MISLIFCEGADESVCAGPLNNNNKHAKVSFHRVLKHRHQETASSTASCSVQELEDFNISSLRKPLNINGYSKDNFKQALVDFQHHIEDQEIHNEKINNKIASTESPLDEYFDAAPLIFADSAIDAEQEAVLDIFPVGVDNKTIELINTSDANHLTKQ